MVPNIIFKKKNLGKKENVNMTTDQPFSPYRPGGVARGFIMLIPHLPHPPKKNKRERERERIQDKWPSYFTFQIAKNKCAD